MSKKKSKKKSFKLSPAKLFILIALVALVVIGCFSLVSYLTRDKYYECTQYDYVTKTPVNGGMTDLVEDLLEDYVESLEKKHECHCNGECHCNDDEECECDCDEEECCCHKNAN